MAVFEFNCLFLNLNFNTSKLQDTSIIQLAIYEQKRLSCQT